MDIRRAHKYNIRLTKRQKTTVDRDIELCRQTYNHGLARKIEHFEETKAAFIAENPDHPKPKGKTLSRYTIQKELLVWKQEQPELAEVYAQCLIDVFIRLDRAYDNFFRRVREGGEQPGFPRFKKYGSHRSMTRQAQASRETFMPDNKHLWFTGKIGPLESNYHTRTHRSHYRLIPADIDLKTVTIEKENNKYYLIFSTLQSVTDPEPEGVREVSIKFHPHDDDIFISDSLGSITNKPKFYLRWEKRIGKIQRDWKRDEAALEKEMMEKIKATNDIIEKEEIENKFRTVVIRARRDKYIKALNQSYPHSKDRRSNWVHERADHYTLNFDIIIMEVPKFKEEVTLSAEHNKILNDSRGYDFVQTLMYKSQERGVDLRLGLAPKTEKPRKENKKATRKKPTKSSMGEKVLVVTAGRDDVAHVFTK